MSEEPKYQAQYDFRDAVLSPRGPAAGTRLVLLALLKYADEKMVAWPTQPTIRQRTGQSPRTVRNHLDRAEELGWITRKRQRVPGKQWRNTIYTLHIPELHTQVQHQMPKAA